ncbi:Arylsulfotransferase (ASST) [Enhygromyxa salina]|uniref:Arylsulfotransferase (ASST) n=1 Tax=Enhygromyxa salina TaxID=215803 RepID=A0A2S9XEW5_9BACT|nr:aryl-sulfate sulfotransferase [Enhygromyxa salina]PRP91409.1 Arylsulfotransferase (ASST) [Enhygromyxa salina]
MRRISTIAIVSIASLACSAQADEPLLLGEVEILHHETQPMVVDLCFALSADATAAARVRDDPGVLSARLEPLDDGRDCVRLRGLAPGLDHEVELTLTAATQPGEELHTLEFTTLAPLPGYIESFTVDAPDPSAVDGDYRLFDLSTLLSDEPLGVFAVDAQGVTRWHLGHAPQSVGLSALWTGLSLRETGELLLVRDDAALIVDELGVEQLRIEAAALGVPGFHHDILELPSGNLVALSFSFRDIDYGPEGVLPVAGDLIVEFTPAGEVVWLWDSFDHLEVNRRVEDFWGSFVIVNPETGVEHHDWTHANGLVYEPSRDELLVSLRHQDWILALDHATGQIRWRLGPEGDFGLSAGTWFWHQHSPQWQPDGSLLLYDNGIGAPELPVEEARSRVVRYELDTASMSAAQVWQDDAAPFLSTVAGDADRSSGGHVLALDSLIALDPLDPFGGAYMRIRELDPARSPMAAWTLTGPVGGFAYRAVPIDRLVGAPRE